MSEYEGKYDPIDFVGRKIKSGDLVAYPVRRGSRMWLTSARVSNIVCRGKEHTIEAIIESGQRVTLEHSARLIVIGENDAR